MAEAPNQRVATSWLRDPRLAVAVISATIFHGGLLASGSHKGTYDAYVHIFFADHYANDWFSSWEPRWYTGFSVVSYPPGTHQLIALVSGVLGLELAFAAVQLVAVLGLVVGIYRFARLWVGPAAAGWAAMAMAISSSLTEVVHVFGQLPTTLSLALLLNAQPSIRRWTHDGHRTDLVAAVALLAATTACHHVTTLFGSVFFTGPVVARAVLDRWGRPLADEPDGHPAQVTGANLLPLVARRARRTIPALSRAAVLGFLTVAALVTVVLPYWLWSSSDPITQVSIPHASRDDFLANTNAGLVFWLIPWASILLIAPYALLRGLASRAWPLAASVALLGLLGTGGTTPIPRLLLGGAFEILTLDRFTIWATIAILPLVGATIESLRTGSLRHRFQAGLGRQAPAIAGTVLIGIAVASTTFTSALGQFRPTQPDPIEVAPIVQFIEKDGHDAWRYLTLGFGDQVAWLSANTDALTVDGNYHSARRLPELTTRSVERLEGAKYQGVPGIGSLQQFLGHPSRYHLKFVFSNDEFYDPLLWGSGWQRLERLTNGVVVWEKPDVAPLPDLLPTREIPGWQRLSWGILPLAALAAAGLALAWIGSGRVGAERFDRRPATPRWPLSGGAALDRHLAQVASRLQPEGERTRWSGLAARITELRTGRGAPRVRTDRRRRFRHVALFVAVVAPVTGILAVPSGDDGPGAVVIAYHDDLDFGRYNDAWQRLDPQTRPDLAAYDLERSVRDGLLVGYGKLDDIAIVDVTIDGDTAVVTTELRSLTAVSADEQTLTHELVRRNGNWYLVPDPADPTVPPDQFLRRTTVEYVSQGRRQTAASADADSTNYHDVLDRPRLEFGDARVVQVDGRWSVVGQVTNIDVDPAAVTIEATLFDTDDRILASSETTLVTVHQVLPRETVPYRIDIEGRAGGRDLDDPTAGPFDPDAFSEPVLAREVAAVEVSARAVVTGRQLSRDLTVQSVRTELTNDGTWQVHAELRNQGVEAATIPHILVTLFDAEGNVAWVDHVWGTDAVRPQRSVSLSVSLTDPTTVTPSAVPLELYANGLRATDGTGVSTIALPSETGWAAMRLDVVTFQRDAS